MAITICGSCVEFGSFTMCDTSPGFSFPGVIKAQCGFCDTREPAGQGSTSGYSSLGYSPSPAAFQVNVDKFSFASDGNATDVGELTQGRYNAGGMSSSVSLYTAGGIPPPTNNVIDKMPFVSEGTGTDVGDLTGGGREGPAGHMSDVSGYVSGGEGFNAIEKFPFASDGNTTDVGEMIVSGGRGAGITSIDFGYRAGGSLPDRTQIEKFPFSTDSNSSDVGELATGVGNNAAGQNSKTNGYVAGGLLLPSTRVSCIQKFPFASDSPGSVIGGLTVNRRGLSGSSSCVSGYSAGGQQNPAICNTIDKFPFATDASATDVGDLPCGKYGLSGHQV